MSAAKNKEFIQNVFNAISTGDGQFLKTAYAKDITFWVAGSLPILSGTHDRSFLQLLTKSNEKAWPSGFTLTVKAMTAEGDRVAVEAEASGAHSSGKQYANKFHFLFVVKDEQIHEWKEYMDTMHAYDVLLSGDSIKNFD